MALPKPKVPWFSTEIVSTGEKVHFRPFLVAEENILLTMKEGGSPKEMYSNLIELVSNCIKEDVDVKELSPFDLEWLFVQLRIKSVGDYVEVGFRHDCKDHEDLQLNRIEVDMSKIYVKRNPDHQESVDLGDGMKLFLKPPTLELIKNLGGSKEQVFTKTLMSSLHLLVVGDEVHEFKDESEKDKEEWVRSLSMDHLREIQKWFETLPTICLDVKYKCNRCKEVVEETIGGISNFLA